MNDQVVTFGPEKSLVGILSKGDKGRSLKRRPAAVILNAGLIHRVGPNRIYVKISRLLAQQGIDVLRFDFSGVGDSSHRKDNLPHIKSRIEEVRLSMDFLARERGSTEFVLIGICSGASFAFQTAYEDKRVCGVIAANVQTPQTGVGEGMLRSAFYLKKAAYRPTSWIKFLIGQSSYREIWKALSARAKIFLYSKLGISFESKELVAYLKTAFREFENRGVRLLFISSDIESGAEYIKKMVGKGIGKMENSVTLQFKSIPEADHTFTCLKSQRQLFDLIHNWIITACIA